MEPKGSLPHSQDPVICLYLCAFIVDRNTLLKIYHAVYSQKLQRSYRKGGNRHCHAKDFILTLMCMWNVGSRW
jgi:hypothetical protein